MDITGTKNQKEYSKSTDYSNIVNGDIATVRILKDEINHVVKGIPGLNKVDYVPDPNVLLKK